MSSEALKILRKQTFSKFKRQRGWSFHPTALFLSKYVCKLKQNYTANTSSSWVKTSFISSPPPKRRNAPRNSHRGWLSQETILCLARKFELTEAYTCFNTDKRSWVSPEYQTVPIQLTWVLISAKETELVGFIWRSMWTIIQKGTVMEPVYPDYQSYTLSTHIYPKLYTLFVLTVINSKGTINIFTSEISEFYMVLPLFLWQKKKFWKKLWIVICSSIWADKNVQKKQKENEEEVIFQTNSNYFYYYYFNMHFIFFLSCKSIQVKVFTRVHCLPIRKPGWNFLRLSEDWFKQC